MDGTELRLLSGNCVYGKLDGVLFAYASLLARACLHSTAENTKMSKTPIF
jgi:hypothetical protein